LVSFSHFSNGDLLLSISLLIQNCHCTIFSEAISFTWRFWKHIYGKKAWSTEYSGFLIVTEFERRSGKSAELENRFIVVTTRIGNVNSMELTLALLSNLAKKSVGMYVIFVTRRAIAIQSITIIGSCG